MNIATEIYNDHVDNPFAGLQLRTLFQTRDVAVAEVEISINGIDYYSAKGVSRREPGDAVDAEVGLKLALGRAIRSLGREILKDGQFLVRENERVRQQQEAAAEAARQRKAERKPKLEIAARCEFEYPECTAKRCKEIYGVRYI